MEGWDAGAREVFLLHGTSSEGAALEIADKGFNVHLARNGMLGKGCYFTDEFCKAAFYANKEALEHDSRAAVVLVCRVIMGHHFQVRPGQAKCDATRPPRKCPCFDVSIGTVNHGPHGEIAVYDPDLVYPELVLVLGKASAAGLPAAQGSAAESPPRQPVSAALVAPFVFQDVRARVYPLHTRLFVTPCQRAAQRIVLLPLTASRHVWALTVVLICSR
eukprot:3466378-Rhodomonas_salina.1